MLTLTPEEFITLTQQDTGVCLACLELSTDINTNQFRGKCPHCEAQQLISLEIGLMYNKIKVK